MADHKYDAKKPARKTEIANREGKELRFEIFADSC